jgi:hypothetical protein
MGRYPDCIFQFEKEQDKNNGSHGSKVIFVLFDNAALDLDLQANRSG